MVVRPGASTTILRYTYIPIHSSVSNNNSEVNITHTYTHTHGTFRLGVIIFFLSLFIHIKHPSCSKTRRVCKKYVFSLKTIKICKYMQNKNVYLHFRIQRIFKTYIFWWPIKQAQRIKHANLITSLLFSRDRRMRGGYTN